MLTLSTLKEVVHDLSGRSFYSSEGSVSLRESSRRKLALDVIIRCCIISCLVLLISLELAVAQIHGILFAVPRRKSCPWSLLWAVEIE